MIALLQSNVRPVNLYSLKAEPARLFNIKDGRELRRCSSPIKTVPKFSIDASIDENSVVGLPLTVFKGQGWNGSRKRRISRKRHVHLEACCHWDVPNDFRITVSIRLGSVEMSDVDMQSRV
jgi:hypothetical protein